MDASRNTPAESASALISKRIADLNDWRGETFSRMRELIKEAGPDVVEEWKWMGTPVWSLHGIICTEEDIDEERGHPGISPRVPSRHADVIARSTYPTRCA